MQETPVEYAGISDYQLYLFNAGKNYQSYEMLGAHYISVNGVKGWRFSTWAPHAKRVWIAGSFSNWEYGAYPLQKISDTGVWYGFFTDMNEGDLYKFVLEGCDGEIYFKADPYAIASELRPGNASVLKQNREYKWSDKRWKNSNVKKNLFESPMLIYECHAGSWRIHDDGSFYSYRELADELVPYLSEMNYTHLELMPLTEYPFDGSWGYQVTGYFCATPRYGDMEGLKYLINKCHEAKIGVIMDWVPAHFPRDAHGLRMFDGAACYEYADPRKGEHKDWGTMVFDFGRNEVICFLMSSAFFWAKEFHIDGLRVDAVSSMLYLDYSRNDGEWVANKYGGNGNLEAIEFIKNLNITMRTEFPNFMMVAEESTAWPKVTAPPEYDGLGFTFKWNMGWMNDTLRYVEMDPYFRGNNHSLATFVMSYAYSENYILPLSHDEVVHGKKSLIDKMFGEYDVKFPEYRAFLGFYMSLPGRKLMFMGGEFGQFLEWRFEDQLEWNLLANERHQRLQNYVRDLNAFYRDNPEMWHEDSNMEGFLWINGGDTKNCVFSYARCLKKRRSMIIAVINMAPGEHKKYRIGVPKAGDYEVIFHSNATKYGGTRRITKKTYKTKDTPENGFPYCLDLAVDSYSAMFLKRKKPQKKKKDQASESKRSK